MANMNLKNAGILRMLQAANTTIEVWAGGFRFVLTQSDGRTRVFSFQVPEHYFVELTPNGPVQVSDHVVREAVEAFSKQL